MKELKRDWIADVSGYSFSKRVQRRIETIRGSGVAAHTRGVLIAEEDPVKFAAAFFAAVHLRMPVILANRRWGRIEWAEAAALVNPAVIFGSTPLGTEKCAGSVPRVAPSTILIPTGGSSGGVKFCVHRWEHLVASCEGLAHFIGPGPIHSCCVLPLFHVSGLMQLVRSFYTGGRIAFPSFDDLRAGRFPDFPSNTTCLSLVATQLQRLLCLKRTIRPLMTARAIFLGGGPAPLSVLEQARELKIPLFLSYGMTETAAMVAALTPDEFLAGQTNAGRPLWHASIEIVGPDGSPCLQGESGRIRIKSRALFKGYHGQRMRNAGDSYLTEDEGCFDRYGRLHVIGRSDRLIISGGEKIDPREVESAILETGAVEQALVLGWPDPEWGQRLVAFYVEGAVRTDPGKWDQELRSDLAHYKLPKLMIPVKRLPMTVHGKVDRRLIQSLIEGALEAPRA